MISRCGRPCQKRRLVGELKGLAAVLGLLDSNAIEFLQGGGNASLDSALIEKLIEERGEAKKNRDFVLADNIRDQLLAQGVVLEDSRDGTRWRREKSVS